MYRCILERSMNRAIPSIAVAAACSAKCSNLLAWEKFTNKLGVFLKYIVSLLRKRIKTHTNQLRKSNRKKAIKNTTTITKNKTHTHTQPNAMTIITEKQEG